MKFLKKDILIRIILIIILLFASLVIIYFLFYEGNIPVEDNEAIKNKSLDYDSLFMERDEIIPGRDRISLGGSGRSAGDSSDIPSVPNLPI